MELLRVFCGCLWRIFMKLQRVIFTFVLSVIAISAQISSGISPIPTVTATTVIPDNSPQFVFLGPTIADITISYPSALQGGLASGGRTTFKIKMLNQVKPILTAN